MRWTRILKYAVILHVTTFVVAFVFGFVEGFVEGTTGAPLPGGFLLALNLVLALTMFAAVSFVYGLMAYRTAGWRVLGAVHLAALAAWLTSLPLNALMGQSVPVWMAQGLFMEFCLLCGLGAGVGVRALVGLLAEPEDRPAVATVAPAGAAPAPVAAETAGTQG